MQRAAIIALASTLFVAGGVFAQQKAGKDGVYEELNFFDEAFERIRQDSVDTRFIVERVLRRGEGSELIDIGARCEGLVAGALQHQHLERAIAVGLVADFRQPFVHRESERVARLRAIERDPADAAAHFVEDVLGGVLGGLRLLVHAWLSLTRHTRA